MRQQEWGRRRGRGREQQEVGSACMQGMGSRSRHAGTAQAPCPPAHPFTPPLRRACVRRAEAEARAVPRATVRREQMRHQELEARMARQEDEVGRRGEVYGDRRGMRGTAILLATGPRTPPHIITAPHSVIMVDGTGPAGHGAIQGTIWPCSRMSGPTRAHARPQEAHGVRSPRAQAGPAIDFGSIMHRLAARHHREAPAAPPAAPAAQQQQQQQQAEPGATPARGAAPGGEAGGSAARAPASAGMGGRAGPSGGKPAGGVLGGRGGFVNSSQAAGGGEDEDGDDGLDIEVVDDGFGPGPASSMKFGKPEVGHGAWGVRHVGAIPPGPPLP